MTLTDKTAPSQTESISFELDLDHAPDKVWRALTDPELLAEWLLPVVDLELEPGAEFMLKAQPQPGWDGVVNCRFAEIEEYRKLSYTWVVGSLGYPLHVVPLDEHDALAEGGYVMRARSVSGSS